MPICEHVDAGCCDTCAATYRAARAQMDAHQRAFNRPDRDIPHDREFPDSGAWIDRDGTVHDTGMT